MVAAGNRVSDKAGAMGELSSALKSRLVHINVESDSKVYLENIFKWKFDRRIYAYLTWKPEQVNSFQQYIRNNSSDDTYRCERTWDMVNTYLRAIYPNQETKIPASEISTLIGMIGSQASEFVQFTNAFDSLPRIEDILANPHNAPLPEDEGAKFLMISMLASRLDDNTQDLLPHYVDRLGSAFMYPFIKMAWMLNDDIIGYASIQPHFKKFNILSEMAR